MMTGAGSVHAQRQTAGDFRSERALDAVRGGFLFCRRVSDQRARADRCGPGA